MLAALLLAIAQDTTARDPNPRDLTFELQLSAQDPELAGHGHSRRVDRKIDWFGTLHMWTSVEGDLATFVRVEGGGGKVLNEDSDSGGGHTPYLRFTVSPGNPLGIVVAAAEPGATGRVVLHLVASPEEQATCEETNAAIRELDEIKEQRAPEQIAAARERVGKLLDHLLHLEHVERSDFVSKEILEAGQLAESLGLLEAAAASYRSVIAHRERTLPPTHVDLAALRINLAGVLRGLGDLAAARALGEDALELLARTQSADDKILQNARLAFAITLGRQGELQRARDLEAQVLSVFERTLPADNPSLLTARANLALTLKDLGELEQARALQESVLSSTERTQPADSLTLATAHANLASTLWSLGDLQKSRTLDERALEVRERLLPPDHPDVLISRGNLAGTLLDLGDAPAARALQESVLQAYMRTLPAEDPEITRTRSNLALTLRALGETAAARALQESVLAARERTLPPDRPELAIARQNLGFTLREMGETERARDLYQSALDGFERAYPARSPPVARARGNLADVLRDLGRVDEARALEERVIEDLSRVLPPGNSNLTRARRDLMITIAAQAARAPAGSAERARLAAEFQGAERAHLESLRLVARSALTDASPRESEARILARQLDLDHALSAVGGYGALDADPALERDVFLLSETCRSAALTAARIARRAGADATVAALRERSRRASAELAHLAQAGGATAEIDRARAEVDAAQRAIVQRAGELVGGARVLEPDLAALVARTDSGDALVTWRRYARRAVAAGGASSIDSLCAWVVRRSGDASAREPTLVRVELGPIAPIESASERWRAAIDRVLERGLAPDGESGPSEREIGSELRALILDPLKSAIGDAQRIVAVFDDVLHAIPLDALPAGDSWKPAGARGDDARVGDRVRVEPRASLVELCAAEPPIQGATALIAIGHPSFDADPAAAAESTRAPEPAAAPTARTRAWARDFATLPETRAEVHAIADYFEDAFGDRATSVVLERTQASRERMIELAPTARWLHVATHGWYAPDSVRCSVDSASSATRVDADQHVVGMSPMLLCGLALAGANRPADALGRIPGLITAQEVATLDLSHCDLAVLSACDTSVGVRARRAGQGVASLQLALHMAGARSVITSLWKVPDEATKDLMVELYRRIWVEKETKSIALWHAKSKLRDARDERGHARYATRDWAAWVLTGEPD